MAPPLRCELYLEGEEIKFRQFIGGVQSQSEWPHKWNKKELTYAIMKENNDSPKNAEEITAMSIALETWEAEIDIKFKRVTRFENPDLRITFRTSQEEDTFAKSPGILAYAYFPGQGGVDGLVVFNDDYRWGVNEGTIDVTNPDGSISHVLVYSMTLVMTHELGHSLGLTHDESGNRKNTMDPYYNVNVKELSDNDIYRIHLKYPVRVFSNWKRYLDLKNWLFRRKRR